MEKKVYTVVALAVLVVVLASGGAYGRGIRGMMGKSQSLSCERTDLEGAVVKNSRGDVIGAVYIVENDRGQSFAIINHGPDSYYGEGGGFTPVPIGALKIAKSDQEKNAYRKTVILNKTEKELEAAPYWDPTKMNDRKYEAKIDKFFGAKPSVCA